MYANVETLRTYFIT